MLKLPDDEFVSLELVHEPNLGRTDPIGLSHLVINVHALDRAVSDLAARGVETEAPTSPEGSHTQWTASTTLPARRGARD